MIKKYFKFKMYSNYFYLIPQIVLTIVLFFFSFEYNHYSKSLGLTTKSTEPLYTFLFHFVRNGNVISVTLDLACAVFFLMQCRKEKLVHIGFFIFYSLYDIMGIFYATYPIPFLGLILHIAYIKLLSDDVSINCNALIIYSCIFGAMKQIPYFFFMFCDIRNLWCINIQKVIFTVQRRACLWFCTRTDKYCWAKRRFGYILKKFLTKE